MSVLSCVRPHTGLLAAIAIALGTAAGSWALDVRYADGQQLNLGPFASKNPGWRRLNWLGLSSVANQASSACLGGLEVSNSEGS